MLSGVPSLPSRMYASERAPFPLPPRTAPAARDTGGGEAVFSSNAMSSDSPAPFCRRAAAPPPAGVSDASSTHATAQKIFRVRDMNFNASRTTKPRARESVAVVFDQAAEQVAVRSEEHTSELQSRQYL